MILILIIISLTFSFLTKPVLATDYYPIGETLPSAYSISGTTGDFQINDTNYRILRSIPSAYNADFQTTAVDVATSKTSTTYTDKASLTWTVPVTGGYLVYATAEINRNSTTALRTTKAQLLIDGISYAESFCSDDTVDTISRTFSGVKIVNLTAGSHTIKIQYASTNTNNIATIKNARITAMRIDNYELNSPSDSTLTSTNYSDISTLTFTPSRSEDWLIMGHADIANSSTTALSSSNLLIDGTSLGEGVVKTIYAGYFMPFDSYATVSLTANTSYTFKIQMKSNSGTITYKNVNLYAIPKSIFSDDAFTTNIGETTTSVGTPTTPTNIATLSFTPSNVGGTYLIAATGEQKNNSLTVFSGIRLSIGNSNVAESIIDVGSTAQYTPFSLQNVISLPASAQTIQVGLFAQSTGNLVGARNVRIHAIKLGAASAQKLNVIYNGVGSTNFTQLNWDLVSAFSLASIGTTLQLYNYNSSSYSTSGDGFNSYTSSSTPNTFEDKLQSITTNPAYFMDASGNWKLKILATNNSGAWINWSGNLLKYSNITSQAPDTPSLISPSDGSNDQSVTPTFETVTTDQNSDNLQYKIQLCTDSAMSIGCTTFDQTTDNTGWSGINVGTSAFSSGTTATYTIQSNLDYNSTYYWRSYAIDYSGLNHWSTTQVTPNSFTTQAIASVLTDESYRLSSTQFTSNALTTEAIASNLTEESYRWSSDDGRESRGVGDTWYDSNYGYRVPVTVTNNVSSTLTDFQIRLTIDTSTPINTGKMRSDCNDIRITDDDKQTSLNYWVESGCYSSSTVVWVKVPQLNASTSKTLYLYYGYSSATAVSNGDNTFDRFDDFNGTTLDSTKWIDYNPSSYGTMTVSGGTLQLTMPSTGSTSTVRSRGIMSANTFNFNNNIIETSSEWNFGLMPSQYSSITKQVFVSDIQHPTGFCSYRSSNGSGNQYMFQYRRYAGFLGINTQEYLLNKCTNGANSEVVKYALINNYPSIFEQEKYSWFNNSGAKETSGRSTDNGSSFSTLWAQQSQTLLSLPGNNYWGFSSTNRSTVSHSVTLDWIRIRKYAATEPTANLGTETTRPTGGGATWLEAENIGITAVENNKNIRLRFSIKNTGDSDTLNFRLQVAPKGASTNCTDVASNNFSDVPTTTGSAVAVMATSSEFADQDVTTNQLTNSSTTFIPGKMVEYSSNQTNDITLGTNEFTEIEYNFQMTGNSDANTSYCFRTVDISNPLNIYTQIAQLTTVVGNQNPRAPFLPFVNNTSAQTGQISPVYGLINHTPVFSAVFDDPNISDTTSNYQIQVGTDTDWTSSETWDSGKTSFAGCQENSRCSDITYGGGNNLVDGSTYYWRIKFWDNSDVGGSWSDTQQFSMDNPPIISSAVLNSDNNINLSENTSVGVSWTATVTDADGYTNLSSARGKIYRSGVGSSCSLNDSNCYQDASCDFVNCSGNSCTILCSANIYFFADPTDTGSAFDSQYYQAWVEATDNFAGTGSTISSSTSVDVNSLSGFSIDSSLVYGEVFAGSDTGSSNTVTTITNTGNSSINLEVTGDYMCTDYPSCSSNSIDPAFQQYKTTTFNYGSGTSLSTSPQIVNINIPRATQNPSNSSKNLYWGIGIPAAKEAGNYQGSITVLVN